MSGQTSQSYRPVLHHLNADSSWLLQLPKQASSSAREDEDQTARAHYNILIDPWLEGSQTDISAWLSRQWHAEPSHIKNVAEVCSLALLAEARPLPAEKDPGGNCLDLVLVSHEFTDHCHRNTLLQVEPSVPILAPRKAAKLIRSWKHFNAVLDLNPFVQGTNPDTVLPAWLHISRLQQSKDSLYLHAAIVISFQLHESDIEECIVYTPHGFSPELATAMKQERPNLKPLCLIHGLHDVWLALSQQINLGGHNGLQVYRQLDCKYWIPTHDEDKTGTGLVAYILKRKPISVEDALLAENNAAKSASETTLKEVNFQNVPNGGSLVLA